MFGLIKGLLEANTPLRQMELSGEDEKRIRGFQFLSQKPMLYVLNLGESDAARLHEHTSYVSGVLPVPNCASGIALSKIGLAFSMPWPVPVAGAIGIVGCCGIAASASQC